MKKYFYKNTMGFSNTYELAYTETEKEEERALVEGFERITRKEAERLCRAERDRVQYEHFNSGYADSVILPIWYPATSRDWRDDPDEQGDFYSGGSCR